jgi:hypothetical protein
VVNEARVALNLSDEYSAAVPVIEAITSTKSGEAGLPEYTHAMDTHGENGCVLTWGFYGDGPGDDRGAKVEVKLKPIDLRIAFRMPDEFVAIEIPADSSLKDGIPLQ